MGVQPQPPAPEPCGANKVAPHNPVSQRSADAVVVSDISVPREPAQAARASPPPRIHLGQLQGYRSPEALMKAHNIPSLQMAEVVFKMADSNGDSDISPDEFDAWLSDMLNGGDEKVIELFINLIDTDNDGTIDRGEVQRALKSQKLDAEVMYAIELAIFHIEEDDRRLSPFISRALLTARLLQSPTTAMYLRLALKATFQRPEPKQRPKGEKARAFARLDVSGDGELSLDELVGCGMSPVMFRAMDANANGIVEKGEFRAYFKKHPDEWKSFQAMLAEELSEALKPQKNDMSKLSMFVNFLLGRGSNPSIPYYVAMWLVMIIVMVGRVFHFKNDYPDADTAVAVAKGAGFALLVVSVVLYLTKCQNLCWATPKLTLRFLFSWTGLHAHAGAIFCIFGLIHTIAHFWWQQGDAFDTTKKVSSDKKLSAAWETITGLILMVCILAMSISGSRRAQNPTAYRPFLRIHQLYYVVLPVLIMHIPFRWYVLAPVLVLVAMNEISNIKNTFTGTMEHCRRIGNSTTLIALPNFRKPGSRPAVSGAYYNINIPSIARFEWHPFSLSTSEVALSEEFLIKDSGKWTNALGKLMSDPETNLSEHIVKIQGSVTMCSSLQVWW